MQFADVLKQLNTLPPTYTRPGNPFAQVQAAKAAALSRYTNASDGITGQVQNFSSASGVWLDAWGKLFGVPRNVAEKDADYRNRITALLVGGHVTPAAIVLYLLLAFGLDATVAEDFAHCSWHLLFNQAVSQTQFNNIIDNLRYVRPAGVPTVASEGQNGGMYLGSVNYLGAPRVTGAYLKTPVQNLNLSIPAYTPNSKPLLPTTFMSDPTFNPGLTG